MKRPENLLSQVRVASPCHESWDEMTGDDRARFCGQCQKTVFNLSAMSADDAERFLAGLKSGGCVRFYRRADGAIMTSDCPKGMAAVRRRFALVATSLAAAVLLVGVAVADAVRGKPAEPRLRFDELKKNVAAIEPFRTILHGSEPTPAPPSPVGYDVGFITAPTPPTPVRPKPGKP